jgi:hypothetical protein
VWWLVSDVVFDLKLGTIIGGKFFPNTGFFEYKDNANQMVQVSYIKQDRGKKEWRPSLLRFGNNLGFASALQVNQISCIKMI